jgi:hypothetical protein
LNEAGFEVLETDMSEFLKSGGACKCLTLKVLAILLPKYMFGFFKLNCLA